MNSNKTVGARFSTQPLHGYRPCGGLTIQRGYGHLYLKVYHWVVFFAGLFDVILRFILVNRHFKACFPALLLGIFTLSGFLDKPWSPVSSLLSPGTCLHFLPRRVRHPHQGSVFPPRVDCHYVTLSRKKVMTAGERTILGMRRKRSLLPDTHLSAVLVGSSQ